MNKYYPNLFSPLQVNRLVLKNRIISAPVEKYRDKAINDFAVMIRGSCGNLNSPRARSYPFKEYMFKKGKNLDNTKKQLAMFQRGGAKASMEILHCGINAMVDKDDYVIGPCDGYREDGVRIQGLDEETRKEILSEYAEIARDAKAAGYDMIMMHFGHGWLPSQCFNSIKNVRDDGYGGSLEDRYRFPKEILRATRNAVGKDFAIDMRISAYEELPGCLSFDEVRRFIKEVAEEGLIDMVNISYGNMEDCYLSHIIPDYYEGHMRNIEYSKKVKEDVDIPVAVVGGINTPEEAEFIIANGYADAVIIGRAGIADPFWAKKAKEGRSDDIIPCIRCGRCDLECSVQLRCDHEDYIPEVLPKSEDPRKIVVIGGGPAGMKAAVTANEAGHDVVLFEKTDRLGGLLKFTDKDEDKPDLRAYKDYLIHQIEKRKITVYFNNPGNIEDVKKEKPDQIVLALGSSENVPPVEGIHNDNVLSCMEAYDDLDRVGDRVVIIGGGLVGCELAFYFARRGHDVSIIEITDKLYPLATNWVTRGPAYPLSKMDNARFYMETGVTKIDGEDVYLSNGEILKVDTVIYATGFHSNNEDILKYYGICERTDVIGDLRRPADIRKTVEEGYFVVADI